VVHVRKHVLLEQSPANQYQGRRHYD
jgi:hypothetical protein